MFRAVNKHNIYIFSANKAFRNLIQRSKSQTIQISGLSGAGKTETAKHILKFLCKSAPVSVSADITVRIMSSSVILEAFGNATTDRNQNSSRFCKMIKVQYHTISTSIIWTICHSTGKKYIPIWKRNNNRKEITVSINCYFCSFWRRPRSVFLFIKLEFSMNFKSNIDNAS